MKFAVTDPGESHGCAAIRCSRQVHCPTIPPLVSSMRQIGSVGQDLTQSTTAYDVASNVDISLHGTVSRQSAFLIQDVRDCNGTPHRHLRSCMSHPNLAKLATSVALQLSHTPRPSPTPSRMHVSVPAQPSVFSSLSRFPSAGFAQQRVATNEWLLVPMLDSNEGTLQLSPPSKSSKLSALQGTAAMRSNMQPLKLSQGPMLREKPSTFAAPWIPVAIPSTKPIVGPMYKRVKRQKRMLTRML
eukprot:536841-Rhodomonas_salina.3